MENSIKKTKGKKALSILLVLIMVLTVASPAFSSMLGVTASAANKFPVELAFNNIFLFEDWANNSLSSTVIGNGPNNGGTLETNVENGSFRLTKTDMAIAEIYTAFSMGTESAAQNEDYYSMPVEPNTTYTFSYNVTGNIWNFTPFVFMYDEQGLFDGLETMASYATPGYGNNRFEFTTPADVTRIQIRFTIGDNSTTRPDMTSVYADVKDIAIYKTDIFDAYKEEQNLFEFSGWAGNSLSPKPVDDTTGTIDPDTSSKTISFTTAATASIALWTGNSILNPATSSSDYYTMAVQPGTNYTLSYNLINVNLPGSTHCQPYIVEINGSGAASYINYETPNYGENSFSFTTKSDTVGIQLVFYIANNADAISRSCKVSQIGLYTTEFINNLNSVGFETITGHTHRKFYAENSSETYGELPTPSYTPDNYVFAGWYTGTNGDGMRITSDTAIHYESLTVYPKFEPKVDTLTVATPPSKVEYTLGEKLNTAGLVLQATINNQSGEGTATTFNITSGYYCTPEYLNAVGTQTITANYGGKTATFTVNVSEHNEKNITVNGATHPVTVANNKYTLDYSGNPFNRYELTYSSDSYVKGVITMDADTEEFFLEPSTNGHFASYVDSFIKGIKHYSVISIEFTCLNKEYGNFELFSVTTIDSPIPSDPTQYYQNDEYKVGISLDYGGVVSYIEDLDDDVSAAVYNENGKDITKVDYTSKLPSGAIATSNSVNLINTNDRGRYLQQSYYGTDQPPFEMGDYNGVPWPYNPVQGGNINIFDPATGAVVKGGEASKVIDYRITADQIYIKTRPLDWGKNSEDFPDSYVTDSYMEAWYTFENGMIKTTCRFVDYSGYPSNTTTQEYPALYTIEPLNHFVYNETAEATAWDAASIAWQTEGMKNIEEPEFWGVLPEYNALLKANGMSEVDVDVDCYENWAAFTASADTDSFGIGVYSAGVTDFHYGVFPAIYNEDEVKNGNLVANYRHAASLDPAVESPTSYISPVGEMTFESYKPSTYSFYVTTGTADQIREDFRKVESIESGEALAKTNVAVPETVYMAPTDGASTVGEVYVNNILDSNNFYNVTTLAEREDNMYFGVHIANAKSFTVDVSNATNPSNDINLCTTSGSAVSTTQQFEFDPNDNFINDGQYELRFSGTGLNPGEKATAKWDITVTMDDGTTQKYAYYTVLYAPGRTVGAVAEARQVAASQHEISSWITGANGVDHSKRAPLGSLHGDYKGAGYFSQDPLVYDNAPSGGSGGDATDYIEEVITGADVDNNVYNDNTYVMQTATNDHDGSRAQSYLGLLTVDKSRYTNTNQIPNLEIGYDVLRIGSYTKNSLGKYTTYYTLGTESAYTATDLSAAPSGWTTYSGPYTDFADSHTLPYRESFVPSFAVSDIDGKYIHALNQGVADQTINSNQYATAGTSVLCSVTDKSGLRESVLTGYGVTNTNPEFDEALENAATVLGDPSATQEAIDNAEKALDDAMQEQVDIYYALKYDNIFSAYEFSQKANSMTVVADRGTATYNSGALTVKNETITGGEAYTTYGSADGYYTVELKPNTEYVFEYDVTTTLNAQAFMFFYNSSGGAGDVPTNMSIKVDNGNWSDKSESNPWWGNYTNGAGSKHYAIKFTTGANTTKASFRFGNTSNDPVTSTFSNIKLIDAAHYYEDVEYTKTEDTYKEYTSYGTLPTLSRTGYTFKGWSDVNNTGITGATIATEHRTIYSQWNENTYNIVYDANGGSGTTSLNAVPYSDNVTLPSSGFTKTDYKLIGWSTSSDATSADYQLGQTVSGLTAENGKTITLYAVWAKSEVNVTFDNLIDISEWEKLTPGNASATFTDTAITLTSKEGAGEGTFESHEFPVTAGKEYKIDIDIEGNNWDVYIFFRNETTGGTGINFTDSGNRFSSSGAGNQTRVFTAPAGATKAVIRLDANNSNNTVKFSNIRVWENTGITVSPVNKIVGSDQEYGTLPTPVREGYKFDGWKNEDGDWIEESYIVNSDKTVNLYSQWTELEYGINFSTNGGTGAYPTKNVKYSQEFTLYDGLTAQGATFLGWSTNQYATTPDFAGGANVNVSQLQEKGIQDNTLHAVWELNEDCVVDDTVVTDFGLAITISPYGNDTGIFIYHALDVSDNGYTIGFSTDNGKTINSTATGTYGNFSVDNTNVIYTPTKVALGVEEITLYTKITYRDGSVKVVSNTIEMVPASSVLFEENYIENKSGSTGAAWATDGTTKTGYQSFTNEETDVYGYDDVYAQGESAHSYGSAEKATVTTSSKRSVTKTFNFIGDGIDLISACGENTGVVIVKISGGDLTSPKAYIVDTYYGDSAVGSMVYQTPIVSFRGNHGTYTVEATAAYLSSAGAVTKSIITGSSLTNGKFGAITGVPTNNAELEALLAQVGMEDIASADLEMVWFDDNSILNGGTGAEGNVKTTRDGETVTSLDCYLDGFRIYHPMDAANDGYIASERNAQYINVVNSVNNNQMGTGSTVLDKIAYVTGTLKEDENGTIPTLAFSNYQNIGPQNELYLAGGKSDALVLQVNLPSPTSKVQLGLRAVTGTATVKIGGTQFDINSATEMYYDVTNCVTVDSSGVATITIQNTGSNLLAVNNIKLTGDATATAVEEAVLEEAALMMSAEPVEADVVNGVVAPVTDGSTDLPGGDVIGNAPSFVQEILAKIFEILSKFFAFLPVEEVM